MRKIVNAVFVYQTVKSKMFSLNNVTKKILVLPTWALTNVVNQILEWSDIDHPTRGKYHTLNNWAQTSSVMIQEVSFILWAAWMYAVIVLQIL